MNTKAKAKIGEVVLLLGLGLFVGGAVGYVTGQLSAEQIPGIGALALSLVVVGAGMKKAKQCAGGIIVGIHAPTKWLNCCGTIEFSIDRIGYPLPKAF